MIKNNYLTQPVKVNIPVTCYDFSELTQSGKMYTTREVEELIKKQKRLTPLIIKNIIDITESYGRKGVMIFSSTVNHAKEILDYLPEGEAKIVLGDTDNAEDLIVQEFKDRKFKYLVNVSVLTTGFDAPHVDVIALLRPTESVSLYQQIIGRGFVLMKESQIVLFSITLVSAMTFTRQRLEKKSQLKNQRLCLYLVPRVNSKINFGEEQPKKVISLSIMVANVAG